jgi:hypothetical protein
MEVNRLLGDELAYELSIRNLPIDGTVVQKRATLREILRAERAGERSPPLSVDIDPFYELSTCDVKLSETEENIQRFNVANRVNEFKRISARLIHLNLRLHRIRCNDELKPKLTQLMEWHQKLVSDLDAKNEESADVSQPNYSLLDTPVPLLPEILHAHSSSGNVEDTGNIPRQTTETERSEWSDNRVAALRQRFEPNQRNEQFEPELRQFTSENPNLEPRIPSEQISPISQHSRIVNHHSSRLWEQHSNRANSSIEASSMLRCQEFVNDHQTIPTRHVTFGNTGMYPNNLNSRMDPMYNSMCDQFQDLQPPTSALTTPTVDRFQDSYSSQNLDVSRWRLQYDGISSVNSFLERVEELRISRGASKERLLRSAPELFTKDALLWYRMGTFSSWDDLVQKLRTAFQPHDYEFALWEEIRRRTQGSQERVISYIAVMENMFKKLTTPPSEGQRVELIKRNMLPYLQTGLSLTLITSIHELCSLAKAIEATEVRVRQFCPPPTNPRLLVEPDLAYRKPTNPILASPVVATPSSNVVQHNPSGVCWNCGDAGHKFKKCSQAKKIFCYRCGLQNVTSHNCSRCPKNARAPTQ